MNLPASLPAPHCFLKIAEIKGDARNPRHEKEIEVVSWSWGETQNATFSADSKRTGGNVSMRDFAFNAVTGAASSQFLLFCASGKRIKTAILTCEKPEGKGDPFLTITLSDVVLASYDIESAPTSSLPMDRVVLRFNKIEFKYVPYKQDGTADGNFTSSWDLAQNAQ